MNYNIYMEKDKSKNNPLFSVIVVSYNAGGKLRETLESAAAQSCRDFEVIVKDAGSNDGSAEGLEDIGERMPESGFTVRISPDKGIYDGMNQAAALSRGEFLYFLNCGDLFADNDTLLHIKERILKDREERKYNDGRPLIYYGDVVEKITGRTAAAKPVMDDFALFRNIPSHQAIIYERKLLEQPAWGFNTEYRVRADYEHFLRCHYRAGAHMIPLGFTIASYEGGGFSETEENRRISAKEHKKITALYMPAGKRFLYRLYLYCTLQPLREKIARNPKTAGIYQKIRTMVYHR